LILPGLWRERYHAAQCPARGFFAGAFTPIDVALAMPIGAARQRGSFTVIRAKPRAAITESV
jgi:hypothetical protein